MGIDPRTFRMKKKELNELEWKIKMVNGEGAYATLRPFAYGLIAGAASTFIIFKFSLIQNSMLIVLVNILVFFGTKIFFEKRDAANPARRLEDIFKRLSLYEPVNMETYRELQEKVKENLDDPIKSMKIITEWIYSERKSVDASFFGIRNAAAGFINKR